MKFLCICLSATIQRTLLFDDFQLYKVNRSSSFIEDASGKAVNTARVLNQLKQGCAEVFCPLGKENYKYFLKLAVKDKLKINFVKIPGKVRSCWTLLSNDGTTTEVVCDEPKIELSDKELKKIENKILIKIKKLSNKFDAFIFAGSSPKIFSQKLCSKICKIIKDNKKILLVDFHGEQLLSTLKSTKPDFIKINADELSDTFSDTSKLEDKILKLQNKYNCDFIITNSTKPVLSEINNEINQFPVKKCSPVNTTACGDSFNAGFIFDLLENESTKSDSLNFANHIACLNAKSIRPGSIV